MNPCGERPLHVRLRVNKNENYEKFWKTNTNLHLLSQNSWLHQRNAGLAIFLIFFFKSKKSDLFDLNQIFLI